MRGSVPYVEKMTSFAHQVEARKRAKGRAGYALLLEMGCGKTKVAIDEMGEELLEGNIEQALILAPNGVISNWPLREIPAHMPDDIRDRARLHLWDGGNTVREKNQIADLLRETDKHGVLSMNLEAIGSSDKAFTLALDFVRARPTAVIIDESTRIKNPDAIVTKTAMRLRDRAVYRRALTGYPNPNSPLDLYSQLDFCVPEALGVNYYSFRHKYAITKDMQVGFKQLRDGRVVPKMTKLVVGFQNQLELAERLGRHSYRALKKDCLDLPPENYSMRKVEMTNEQWRVYREMVNKCTAELDGQQFVTATMIITQMLRLHQIVCGFVTADDGTEVPIKSNRLRSMSEHVEEWCGRPGIVWCTYQHNIREVTAQLESMYPGRVTQYHGGVDKRACDRAIDEFQGGDKDYFVATEQKGGFGITLVRAADDLYYSNTWNLEHRLQSEARTHRSGQTQSVNHGDLVAEGTVDQQMLRKLRQKMDIGDAVLQDGYRKWVM